MSEEQRKFTLQDMLKVIDDLKKINGYPAWDEYFNSIEEYREWFENVDFSSNSSSVRFNDEKNK